ncbi:YdhK family protein [Corynebacterium qintianiae]|uniref:YdhK family protein n=1 Tax=Corynebacterium qintianiae TaxID=2709392 RepID=A0A7T0PEY4_9CORY|nr:YdhK family protein [Corynebacterium qintianiae]QPK83280.1 YdhK family protein [Corynebacterium qintianiae]
MKTSLHAIVAALSALSLAVLTACSPSEEPSAASHAEHSSHDHATDGGPAPVGIAEAESPTFPVGTRAVLRADHMPGMDGAPATIAGAYDTVAYAVSYTPVGGGEPVTNHKWVVQEEIKDAGDTPLPDGATVTLEADHMSGMQGAEATIDSSTAETVYMVDYEADGMKMANHKWVVESEIEPYT